jgi:Xaa-Pro dipeptidase
MSKRLDALSASLKANGLAATAVVPGANLLYLAGLDMHRSERLTVTFFTAEGDVGMVIPTLEAPRARAQAKFPIKFYTWDDAEGPYNALRNCLTEMNLTGSKIGVEYTSMRVLELRGMEEQGEVEASDATNLLADIRARKDSEEVAAIRVAVRYVEEGLRETIKQMRAGMTEIEVQNIWMAEVVKAGGTMGWTPIVASGPNGANPHHSNTDRKLQKGDLVVLDGGAHHGIYQSDITRTVAIGEPSEEARRVYELVLAANTAGREASRVGATGAEIDAAARKVIIDGGYGPQFLHRTGHGLGIEGHEPPYIVASNHLPLPPGAVFTIEPGIYVEGVVGVRIEDDVIVTEDGAESLTTFERELIIIDA